MIALTLTLKKNIIKLVYHNILTLLYIIIILLLNSIIMILLNYNDKELIMKQCPDCKTFKKADNCMICAILRVQKIKDEIKNILDLPLKDYQKLEKINNLIKGE